MVEIPTIFVIKFLSVVSLPPKINGNNTLYLAEMHHFPFFNRLVFFPGHLFKGLQAKYVKRERELNKVYIPYLHILTIYYIIYIVWTCTWSCFEHEGNIFIYLADSAHVQCSGMLKAKNLLRFLRSDRVKKVVSI